MLSYGVRRIAVYGTLWLTVLLIVLWRREDERPIGRWRWLALTVATLMFLVALSEAGY